MVTTSARYQYIAANPERSRAAIANDAQVKRETQYFRENIGEVRSAEDLISNSRLFRYVMKAFGLEDMTYAKALIRKLMEEGAAQAGSMANRINNPLYKELAKTFDFGDKGAELTSAPGFADAIANRYVQQTLEDNEGASNEGVRLALYFKRKASGVTKTVQLLADESLLTFVQTTLGIPSSASAADIDTQIRQIERRLDVADFQDPDKVDRLIQRFSAMYDMNNTTVTELSPVLSLFSTSGGQSNIGYDLLLKIASLPKGGY